MYDYRKFLKSLNIVAIIIVFLSIFVFNLDYVYQRIDGKLVTDYGSMFVSLLLTVLFTLPFSFYLQSKPHEEKHKDTVTLVLNSFAALLLPLVLFSLITGHNFDGSPYTSSNYDVVMLLASSVAILNIFSLIKREK